MEGINLTTPKGPSRSGGNSGRSAGVVKGVTGGAIIIGIRPQLYDITVKRQGTIKVIALIPR